MVNVSAAHEIVRRLSDILAAKPCVVWMQLGISQDEVAEALARAAIKVAKDRCLTRAAAVGKSV